MSQFIRFSDGDCHSEVLRSSGFPFSELIGDCWSGEVIRFVD